MKEHRISNKHVTAADDHEDKLMHSPNTVTHKKQKKNTQLLFYKPKMSPNEYGLKTNFYFLQSKKILKLN